MARFHFRYVYISLFIALGVIYGWYYFNESSKEELITDDRLGIVPKEGLGHAGDVYPTKPPGMKYPTLKPGALKNPALGFILQDNDNPVVVRGRWFQDDLVQPKQTDDPEKLPKKEKLNNDSYVAEKKTSRPEHMPVKKGPQATIMPKLDGVNVISMTLYGSQLRYTMGAIRNAELAKVNFPGWSLRIYTETPSEHPRYGLVPATVIERLRALGADIHYIDPQDDWVPPMMWRFLVADDADWVDRFIIRDCDSRLIERDAAAVYDWVKSERMFHSIRDHPSHASFAISGGLWGAKPKELTNHIRKPWKEFMRGRRKDYFEDMDFLNKAIWPKVEAHAFCSDSVSCNRWPNSYPFPIPRYGYEHVGEVYDEHDLGRPMDIDIIRHTGENENCLPGKKVFQKGKISNMTATVKT